MEFCEEDYSVVLNKEETAKYYASMLAEDEAFDDTLLQEVKKRNMGEMITLFLYDGTTVNVDYGEEYYRELGR